MKRFLTGLSIFMLALTLVTEAQAQRRGSDNDDWRRDRRGGETRRDRGHRREPRNGGTRRDRGDRRDPNVGHRRPDRRDPDVGHRRPHRPDPDVSRRPHRRDPDWRRDRHTRHRHRPHWSNPTRRYSRHIHKPHQRRYRGHRRYRRYDYHRTIPYRYIYWDQWVRYRVTYNDGFVLIGNYPYYVYNGYRHRYSSYDQCDYDLVDGWNNTVERTFYGYNCRDAYDYCADMRDDLNWRRSDYRYFCSERLDFSYGRYDNWDYEDDFYYDVY